MKEFINKIKNMDKTKRIVILFITISFVFIGGFSIYNGVTGNYKTNQVAQVDITKNKKEKTLTGKISIPPISILLIVKSQKSAPHRSSIGEQAFIAFIFGIRGYPDFKITGFRSVFHF